MSRSCLVKKLHLAKKVWKSFTITVKSKFHKLKTSKAVKTTTRRLLALRSFRFSFPFKRCRPHATKPSYQYHQHYYKHLYDHDHLNPNNQLYNNYKAVHIDELFEEHGHAETCKGKEVVDDDQKVLPRKRESVYSVEDAWKAVVASSPHLRGVDERAEEFISKFREDMKLQKEQSLIDYQEMLNRSA